MLRALLADPRVHVNAQDSVRGCDARATGAVVCSLSTVLPRIYLLPLQRGHVALHEAAGFRLEPASAAGRTLAASILMADPRVNVNAQVRLRGQGRSAAF